MARSKHIGGIGSAYVRHIPICDGNISVVRYVIYALMVVGGGTFASGAVLKVRSMVFGGAFSVGFGFGLICCLLTGIAIKPVWLMPIFILCFGLMMILPGLEMRQKARKEYERA